MNASMRTAIVAACLIFVASQAAGKNEGLQAFRDQTKASIAKCDKIAAAIVLAYKLGADGAKFGGGNLDSCVAEAESDAKAAYQKAAATARPEGAKAALKRYYASWLSSLRTLGVRPEDSEVTRTKRLADNDQRQTDAWALVEIEAGL
jgi:hypothetical protein